MGAWLGGILFFPPQSAGALVLLWLLDTSPTGRLLPGLRKLPASGRLPHEAPKDNNVQHAELASWLVATISPHL